MCDECDDEYESAHRWGYDVGYRQGLEEMETKIQILEDEIQILEDEILELNPAANPIKIKFQEKVFELLKNNKGWSRARDTMIKNIENELDIFLQCGV